MFQEMLQGGSGDNSYVIKDVTFNNIVTGGPWNTVTFNNTLDFTPKEVISVEVLTATWNGGTGKCYVADYSCSGNNLNVSVLKNSNDNTVTITYRIICSL